MADIALAALDGGEALVDEVALEGLMSELRGPALRPGEPGYDEARTLYNAMIDRKPAIILRCAGVADVMAGVKFAAAHGLLLSVRGGGHNVAGNAVCDGGLMLDLSAMNSVRVDPKAKRAFAEGGATWSDYDAETQAFGLGSTGGLISSTGVGGLTLGGGIGWLQGRHGLACDNVISFDMVTATGQLVTASAEENPDLYWGLRGGGGTHTDNAFLTRSAERLPYLMKWFENNLANEQQGFFEGSISVQDIFLTCHLSFTANRPIGLDPDLDRYPKVKAMVTRMEERASFQENPILWWEPGVIGYADDGKTPLYETAKSI